MSDATEDDATKATRFLLNKLALGLNSVFNGSPERSDDDEFCFVLLSTKFDRIGKEGNANVNYVSNGDRGQVIAVMKEMIARWEGRFIEPENQQPS